MSEKNAYARNPYGNKCPGHIGGMRKFPLSGPAAYCQNSFEKPKNYKY